MNRVFQELVSNIGTQWEATLTVVCSRLRKHCRHLRTLGLPPPTQNIGTDPPTTCVQPAQARSTQQNICQWIIGMPSYNTTYECMYIYASKGDILSICSDIHSRTCAIHWDPPIKWDEATLHCGSLVVLYHNHGSRARKHSSVSRVHMRQWLVQVMMFGYYGNCSTVLDSVALGQTCIS